MLPPVVPGREVTGDGAGSAAKAAKFKFAVRRLSPRNRFALCHPRETRTRPGLRRPGLHYVDAGCGVFGSACKDRRMTDPGSRAWASVTAAPRRATLGGVSPLRSHHVCRCSKKPAATSSVLETRTRQAAYLLTITLNLFESARTNLLRGFKGP